MPSNNWGKQGKWPPNVENKVIQEGNLKDKLEDMNMTQLRAYAKAHNLQAKDNDKVTLIKEILEEVQ